MKESIENTFCDFAELNSTSGNEGEVASLASRKLTALGLEVKKDEIGNVIGFLPGEGEPILLNAHLDGVAPAKGHIPVKEGDVLRGDGTTNLRADDIAGVTIILEALKDITESRAAHPPIVVAFTVQEEIGLLGAKALDVSEYGVTQGITYDNAFEAGVVVNRGAAYIGFDVEILGKETHPGKDLSNGANAIQVFLDTGIKMGELDNGNTRLNIGSISGGKARNIVPGNLSLQGEVRSFLQERELDARIEQLQTTFQEAAARNGAEVKFSTKKLAFAYEIDPNEPLIQRYKEVIEKRGGAFEMKGTFVASDANALRGGEGAKSFCCINWC